MLEEMEGLLYEESPFETERMMILLSKQSKSNASKECRI
jgi:hypothetical protein